MTRQGNDAAVAGGGRAAAAAIAGRDENGQPSHDAAVASLAPQTPQQRPLTATDETAMDRVLDMGKEEEEQLVGPPLLAALEERADSEAPQISQLTATLQKLLEGTAEDGTEEMPDVADEPTIDEGNEGTEGGTEGQGGDAVAEAAAAP